LTVTYAIKQYTDILSKLEMFSCSYGRMFSLSAWYCL